MNLLKSSLCIGTLLQGLEMRSNGLFYYSEHSMAEGKMYKVLYFEAAANFLMLNQGYIYFVWGNYFEKVNFVQVENLQSNRPTCGSIWDNTAH
jgi:hypothetical protein